MLNTILKTSLLVACVVTTSMAQNEPAVPAVPSVPQAQEHSAATPAHDIVADTAKKVVQEKPVVVGAKTPANKKTHKSHHRHVEDDKMTKELNMAAKGAHPVATPVATQAHAAAHAEAQVVAAAEEK